MANRYGQFYGYTGFFPIMEGEAPVSHADELRSLLATLPNDETSLFSRTGLVHAARFFLVDDVVYNGQPSREDHLSYAYLGVSVTFDGELEGLAARIAEVALAEFRAIFSRCYGYDGASTAAEILAYLKACQIETTFLYVQVADATLDQTLRALAAQKIIADMIVRGQGLDAPARKALVRQVAALVASAAPAPAGAFAGPDAHGEHRMKLDLADIQGNVLRSYNLPVARYLFVNLTDAAKARALLGRLVPLVTNAQAWDAGKPATTFNVGFTQTGLAALGLPPGSLNSFPLEFQEGMIARGPVLGDIGRSDKSLWEPLWRGRVDTWMSINAGSPALLEPFVEALKGLLSETGGGQLVGVQDAAALTADGKILGTEHFGYADGFSQPNFVGGQAAEVPGAGKLGRDGRWQDIEAGEFILGHRNEAAELPVAPTPPVLAKNGTYLVYRKLEQDVARFRAYVAKVGAQYPGGPEKLMAKFVGRWRDGTPLALSPDAMNPAVAQDTSRTNNFTYGDDPEGLKCPIGSHIRRTNPRDSNGFEGKLATRRRILRRGLPYGTFAPEGEENDGQERGIIFMALNASISRQFEFVQQQWVNYGNDFKQGEARDPLIGGNEGTGRFVIPGDNARGAETFICADLPNFVTLRGGGYFFLPSLTALRLLAADRIDPR